MKIIKWFFIESDYNFYFSSTAVGLLIMLQGYIMINGNPEKLQNNLLVGLIGLYLGLMTVIGGIRRMIISRKKKNVGNIN